MTKQKKIALALTLLFAVTLSAQTQAHIAPPRGYISIEKLWPEAASGAVGVTEEDAPKLYCYPAPGPGPHPAILIIPGGGYVGIKMGAEGNESRWLNTLGVSAYILQYRLFPRYRYPVQAMDGERAVRLLRSHASAWNLRPDAIGVWGFSAGGHLAGYLATANPLEKLRSSDASGAAIVPDAIDTLPAHPDFAIVSYGKLSLDPSIPGGFNSRTMLGEKAPQAEIDRISPILHVSKSTSPTFLYANEFDNTVDSTNASLFFNALRRLNVPAELHIFQRGQHGNNMGTNLPETPELAMMPILLVHWLQANGWVGKQAPDSKP